MKEGSISGLINLGKKLNQMGSFYNVGAELQGAKRAVELALANDIKKLVIYYDYLGIEKFATNVWKAKPHRQ